MARNGKVNVVDHFLKAARLYAAARQELEEAKANGNLTAQERFQIQLLQPCVLTSEAAKIKRTSESVNAA